HEGGLRTARGGVDLEVCVDVAKGAEQAGRGEHRNDHEHPPEPPEEPPLLPGSVALEGPPPASVPAESPGTGGPSRSGARGLGHGTGGSGSMLSPALAASGRHRADSTREVSAHSTFDVGVW